MPQAANSSKDSLSHRGSAKASVVRSELLHFLWNSFSLGTIGCFRLFALLGFCLAAEVVDRTLANCCFLRSSSAIMFNFSRVCLSAKGEPECLKLRKDNQRSLGVRA